MLCDEYDKYVTIKNSFNDKMMVQFHFPIEPNCFQVIDFEIFVEEYQKNMGREPSFNIRLASLLDGTFYVNKASFDSHYG